MEAFHFYFYFYFWNLNLNASETGTSRKEHLCFKNYLLIHLTVFQDVCKFCTSFGIVGLDSNSQYFSSAIIVRRVPAFLSASQQWTVLLHTPCWSVPDQNLKTLKQQKKKKRGRKPNTDTHTSVIHITLVLQLGLHNVSSSMVIILLAGILCHV